MLTNIDATAQPDVQAGRPAVALALPRVGVTGLERTLAIGPDDAPAAAHIDLFVDLAAGQRGAHMSRFEEALDAAVRAEPRAPIQKLAGRVAEEVRMRQDGLRAEVAIMARVPRERVAPVSGISIQEHFTLLADAVATGSGIRTLIGVSAQGITACPCAQELVAGAARERLAADGFTDDEVHRILEAVPVATHNQRGVGTLQIGVPASTDATVDPLTLLEIVESSMSSEIYELMKRPDEAAVVEKAHRRPRFVEDCVREMLADVVERFGGLPQQTLVCVRQENLETIHQHNVVATWSGLLGDLRAEIDTGAQPVRQVSAPEWLGAGEGDLSVRRNPKK